MQKTDIKQQIALYAFSLYREKGFMTIPMDEIAKGMKISKKTIYKYYNSKEDLVEAAFRSFILKASTVVGDIMQKDVPSVVKLVFILKHMLTETAMISTMLFKELQTEMPLLWKDFDDFRSEMMRKTISKIYAQGREEGYIKEYPVIFIVTILVASIREILKKEFLDQSGYTINESLSLFYKFLFNTILTPKGKEEFSTMIYGVIQNENI